MNTETSWKSWMQLLFGLGLTYLFFYMMAPFVVPILLGAIAALLVYPLYSRARMKMPKPLAALTVTIALTLGILAPLGFLLVSGSQRLIAWISQFRFPKGGNVEGVVSEPMLRKFLALVSRFTPVDKDWLQGQLLELLQSIFEIVSKTAGNFLASMPGHLLTGFVMMISIYFFLIDGSRFLKFLSTLSPIDAVRSNDIFLVFEKSCRGVVIGLFSSALAQGVLVLFFFLVTGVPNAVLFGLFAIIMGMVPVVGNAPLTIGALLYLFGNGQQVAGFVMIGGFAIITTIDNVVRSLVLKGQSEMHPLLALVSAFGATSLMGPPGIFLGPIIAAVFVSFLEILSLEMRRESIQRVQSGER